MVLLLAVLLALHAAHAAPLHALARRLRHPAAPLAWVPVANFALPFALAGRSLWWATLLLLPPLNLAVWVAAWAEASARAGRSRAWGIGVAVGLAAVSMAGVSLAYRYEQRASVGPLQARLQDGSPDVRRAAADRLGASGGGADALASALADPDPGVRAAAARALGRLRARGSASALLQAATADADASVRGEAARAFAAVGGDSAPRGPAVVAALLEAARGREGGDLPQAEVVDALARAARDTPDSLRAALFDADAGVRWHAAAGLMQLGRTAAGLAPALMVAMRDESWTVRNAAGRALEEVAGPEDVDALARALGDESEETRYHVARALARVGGAAVRALPALVTGLRDTDAEVRAESAWALARLGSAARASAGALRDTLGDPDPHVRTAAVIAVSNVDEPSSAAAALSRAASDPAPEVRRAAREALRRVRAKGA